MTERVVDAHVHFWDPGVLTYPWLDALPPLHRPLLPAQYPADAADAVVFVEANCSGGSLAEIQFAEQFARAAPPTIGLVAFVDLREPHEREQTLARLADHPLVVGARQNIEGQPAGFCLEPEFVRGVQELGHRGLTFDVCVTADQLRDVERLVAQCPDTSFVLDHCGKPAIRHGAFGAWAAALRRLAQHENVACKLSGLLTEARDDQRDDEALRPYAEHALECFGVSRLLYGSDWPVVTLTGGLPLWRALVDRFVGPWSAADRQAFYANNAIRLYGLRLHANA
jgi:L-fuconolactonase